MLHSNERPPPNPRRLLAASPHSPDVQAGNACCQHRHSHLLLLPPGFFLPSTPPPSSNSAQPSMAALASSRQTAAPIQQLTPPSSSHGGRGSWDFAVPVNGLVRTHFPFAVCMSHNTSNTCRPRTRCATAALDHGASASPSLPTCHIIPTFTNDVSAWTSLLTACTERVV